MRSRAGRVDFTPLRLGHERCTVDGSRTTTSDTLAHIAETDVRKLYLPEGYPNLLAFSMGELHYSEDAACKRITAARAARKFPVIFEAIEQGRLHLSDVVMLAPRLTPENAGELLAAATHRSKAQIAELLAQRFPKPDVPATVRELAPASMLELSAPGRMEPPAPHARGAPLSAHRYEVRLRYALKLLAQWRARKVAPAA